MTAGPVLGILGGGIVVGLVAGYLLHGSLSDKIAREPSHVRPMPALAMGESVDRTRDVQASAQLFSAASPDEPSTLRVKHQESATDAGPLKVASSPGSLHLLDRARHLELEMCRRRSRSWRSTRTASQEGRTQEIAARLPSSFARSPPRVPRSNAPVCRSTPPRNDTHAEGRSAALRYFGIRFTVPFLRSVQ